MSKQVKNGKRHQLIGTLAAYPNKKVKYLQSFYFQGGKWHKLKPIKGV